MSGQQPPEPSAQSPRRQLVLCIDDQEDGLRIRKLFLETMGYEVLTAARGRAALNIIARHHIDAVILDYRMPEMDGEAVAAELRRIHPRLPIVMLSGYVPEIPGRVHELVNAFVSKGSPPTELLNALQTALGSSPKKPARPSTSAIMQKAEEQLERSRALLAKNRDLLRQLGRKN